MTSIREPLEPWSFHTARWVKVTPSVCPDDAGRRQAWDFEPRLPTQSSTAPGPSADQLRLRDPKWIGRPCSSVPLEYSFSVGFVRKVPVKYLCGADTPTCTYPGYAKTHLNHQGTCKYWFRGSIFPRGLSPEARDPHFFFLIRPRIADSATVRKRACELGNKARRRIHIPKTLSHHCVALASILGISVLVENQ
ncbi:hypothetical protein S40288_11517 [Stachybotrys chartarum IBT 40288]|nr:hypothetical protein S40288_11517 [Stachybotrys chartarum IBT 40288]